MTKYLQIGRQIGVSYVTMILTSILGALSIFFLTRGLTVAEYGIYALLVSTAQICAVVFDLGLSQYILTKLPGQNIISRVKEFFSIYIFDILFYIIILIIYSVFENNILSLIKLTEYQFEFRLTMGIIFISSLLRYNSDLFAAEKRIGLKNMVVFLQKAMWVIFVIAFYIVFKELNIRTVITLWLLGVIVALFFCFTHMKKHFVIFFKRLDVKFKNIKKALVFSLPLVPFLIGSWLIIVSDRYILNHYWNSELVGIYTLAYSLLTIVFTLSVTISTVLYPYIAEAYNKAKDHNLFFNTSLKYSLILVLPGTSLLFFMRKQIISLISGVEYLGGSIIITILFLYPILATLNTLFYQNMLLREKTKTIGVIFVIGAIINISLNFWLIPKHGMIGAAIATLVSYIIISFVMYANCRKHLKLNHKFLKIIRVIIGAIIIGAITIPLYPESALTKILTLIVSGLLYLALIVLFNVLNKDEVDTLKRLFQKIFK